MAALEPVRTVRICVAKIVEQRRPRGIPVARDVRFALLRVRDARCVAFVRTCRTALVDVDDPDASGQDVNDPTVPRVS